VLPDRDGRCVVDGGLDREANLEPRTYRRALAGSHYGACFIAPMFNEFTEFFLIGLTGLASLWLRMQ
jgi:hypothetical protein